MLQAIMKWQKKLCCAPTT